MPVKLYTGLPGAGKTACLVAEMIRLRKAEPERPVYQYGISGLAEGIAESLTMDQLVRWWELPPGAIICIDEAQEPGIMPLDKGQPADWIKRISKVRHEGMDFLLTTQHPSMLSSYVRRLVDLHVHAVRKFNTSIVSRYKWGRCMENCEKDSAHRSASVEVGTLPKEVFDLYKSANAHNMKRRIPLRVYLLPGFALLAVGMLVATLYTLKHMGARPAVAPSQVAQVDGKDSSPKSADTRSESEGLRQRDFAKWMEPRVAGLLWTAPAFDNLPVRAVPRVFCIAVEDGATHCVTEQGTTVEVPAATARTMARDGVYNPFVSVESSEGRRGDLDSRAADGRAAAPSAGPAQPAQTVPTSPVGAGSVDRAGLRSRYVPPGYLTPMSL